MPAQDLFESGGDAYVESRRAFTTRHEVPVRFGDPARPRLGISFRDLFRAESLPFAEIDLAKRFQRLGLQDDRPTQDLGRLERALEVARVDAGELASGQARPQEGGLAAALLRERRVELSLDAVVSIPRGLPVADEEEAGQSPRRRWRGGVASLARWDWALVLVDIGDAGFGRLRARRSDLDAYTNFLLDLDRAGPISGERFA